MAVRKKTNVKLNVDKEESKKMPTFKVKCKFKNKGQKEMSDIIKSNRITFVEGPAGTGKSIIALKVALDIIKQPKYRIQDILITKPIVSVGNDLGHLPGGVNDKTNVFFNSIYANLNKLVDKEVAEYLRKEVIEERVLNYMRGETMGNYTEDGEPMGVYCIMDEGQNTTPMEMKTYLSRLGEFSKIIVLFDPDQIDIKLRRDDICGAVDAKNRLTGLEGVGYIKFTEDDIVRDPFLIEIMKRYKD